MNSFKKQTQGDALFFPSSPSNSYGDATVPHKRAPTIKENDETTFDEDDDLIILDEYYIPLSERVKRFHYTELGADYDEDNVETFVRSKKGSSSKRSHSRSRESTPAKRCRTVSPDPSITPIDQKELETIPKARSNPVKREPDNLRLVSDAHKEDDITEDRVEKVQPRVQLQPEHGELSNQISHTEQNQIPQTEQKAVQVQGEVKVPILKNVHRIPITGFLSKPEPIVQESQNAPQQQSAPVVQKQNAPVVQKHETLVKSEPSVEQLKAPVEHKNPVQQVAHSSEPAKSSTGKENRSLIPDELRRAPLLASHPTKISASTLKEMSTSFSKPVQSSKPSLSKPSHVEPSHVKPSHVKPSLTTPDVTPAAVAPVVPDIPAAPVAPVAPVTHITSGASVASAKPATSITPTPATPATPAVPSNKGPTLISNNQNRQDEKPRKVSFETKLENIFRRLKTDKRQAQKEPIRHLISSNSKKDDHVPRISQLLSSFEENRFNIDKEFRWCALNELKKCANQAFWQSAMKKSGIFWTMNKWLRFDMKSKNPENVKEIVEILHKCSFPVAVLVSYKLDKPLNLLYGKLQKSQDPKELELASVVKKVLNPVSLTPSSTTSKQPADIFKTMSKQPAQVSKSSIYVAPTKKANFPPAVSPAPQTAPSALPVQEQKKAWSFADYRNAAKRKKSTEAVQAAPQEEKKEESFLDEHERAKTKYGLVSLLRKSSDKHETRKPRKMAQKGVQWKPHADLTQVREFFSDPSERVSMPIADLPQEGSALRNRAMEDDEPPLPVESQGDILWKDPACFDFSQIPWFSKADAQFNVESKGGEEKLASVEKSIQQERCNFVSPANSQLTEKLQPSVEILERTALIPSFGHAANGARI